MNSISRECCILCGGDIEELHVFSDFPIYMGVSTRPKSEDLHQDMSFAECIHCGCVQLAELVPLEILYANGHNAAIGKTWETHHIEFHKFIKKYAKGTIMEIGGGNLILARNLEKQDSVDKIIVHDFNSYGSIESNKIIFKSSTGNTLNSEDKVDMIVHSHLIEHLYNPISDLRQASSLLPMGGHMALAAPLIDAMLVDKFTNAMNFEHSYMLTYKMIEQILSECGFRIVDKKNFSPHVTFIVSEKIGSLSPVKSKYNNSSEILNNFILHHQEEVTKIQNQMASENEKAFIFGAHIFTQFLLGFGLQEDLFLNVLDNDPAKIGNRLYGTSLQVESPKILKDFENPVVVLKAAMYTEEIKKDILENINPNTRFIL